MSGADVEYLVNDKKKIHMYLKHTHTYTHTHSIIHVATHSEVLQGPALPFTGEDRLWCSPRFSDHNLLTVPILGFLTGLAVQQHLLQFSKWHCFHLKCISLVQETNPIEIIGVQHMTNAGNNNTPRLPEAAQYFKRDNVTTINIKRNKKERKKNKQITFTYSK